MPELKIPHHSFMDFIQFLKKSRVELLCGLGLYLVLYFFVTALYPMPGTLVDSANYVYCAKVMKLGGFRPFGYSWYINFIHGFSASLGFLIASQFFLTGLSSLFFCFSVKYFFRIQSSLLWYSFLGVTVVAPSALFLANSLLSDSLFFALTLFWLGSALWIIYCQNIFMIVVHVLTMYWAMEVRYTGVFYPVISAAIFFMSFKRIALRLGLAASSVLMIVFFVKKTKNEMKREFDVEIFSGFTGWTTLNNALHILPYTDLDPRKIKDDDTQAFFKYALSFDSSIYKRKVYTYFMWSKESPLKKYLNYRIQTEQMPYIQAWLLCGKDFDKYGSYLIKKYPGQYLKHYFIPNLFSIFYPPTHQGFIFFSDEIVVDDMFHEWYGLEKGIKFSPGSTLFKDYAQVIVIGNLLIWLAFFAAALLVLIKRKQLMLANNDWKAGIMLVVFVVLFTGFSAYAAPYEIRYGLPVRPVLLAIPFIVFSFMSKARSIRTL